MVESAPVAQDGVLLEASGIAKSFGGIRAVDDVSIRVAARTIHAVIGPNGAGKTTFFNVLSGFYPPDRGAVRFAGTNITRMPNWRRIALGMSRTFQTPSIFAELPVRENVMLGVRSRARVAFDVRMPRGERGKRLDARVAELLSFVNLSRYADRPVAELSHGGQRLCEIAMSLSTDPTLVLLDEPMAGLAQSETERIMDVIRKLHSSLGLTVLFVEHNMRVVLALSQRVTVLDRGRILAEGTPSEIATNEAVRAAYLGAEAREDV